MSIRWATEAEATEARERITSEYLQKYHEWLGDYETMEKIEYAQKYGYYQRFDEQNNLEHFEDSIKAITYFQKYIFSGRWGYAWERLGYSQSVMFQLALDGFISHKDYRSGRAIASGKTNWFYISQKTAKELWKNNR